ncbi:MAG: hypothetical protein COA88_03880 [Kordia sp.]|nr:MAG: hypothetical protein COA88_03880 [Kordia sp.]
MKYIKPLKREVNNLFPIVVLLYYPFIILSTIGACYLPSLWSYIREVIAFGLLTSVLFVVTSLFSPTKLRKYLIVIFNLILSALVFIKLIFYQQFGAKINASALFVVFETNTEEASGFISDYINKSILFLFIGLLLLSIFLVKRLLFSAKFDEYIFVVPRLCFKNNVLKGFVMFLFLLSGYVIFTMFYDENIIIKGLSSYNEYLELKECLKTNLAKERSENIKVFPNNDEATYVVIIGESTSRWHMQLYDYNRETNPLLTEIKDELFVFSNVISPHTHTILSLEKVLTLSDYWYPNKDDNASIVQLANHAGFSTYWLSNQRPVGIHESIPTMIGNAAKYKYYVNSDDTFHDVYDEKIFPYLDNILKSELPKKMIFIHLIGTHTSYKRRYPEKFNYFSGENSKTKFKHENSLDVVNEYDNAVRYNDSIVRTIIEKIKEQNTNSYVLYFSDHGEDVFDIMDSFGHNEINGTKPMYDVPFVIWLSEKYKRKNNSFFTTNDVLERSYNLEDFIHSFSDLSNISFDQFNPSKSVFNKEYVKSKRLIKNGIDYDER